MGLLLACVFTTASKQASKQTGGWVRPLERDTRPKREQPDRASFLHGGKRDRGRRRGRRGHTQQRGCGCSSKQARRKGGRGGRERRRRRRKGRRVCTARPSEGVPCRAACVQNQIHGMVYKSPRQRAKGAEREVLFCLLVEREEKRRATRTSSSSHNRKKQTPPLRGQGRNGVRACLSGQSGSKTRERKRWRTTTKSTPKTKRKKRRTKTIPSNRGKPFKTIPKEINKTSKEKRGDRALCVFFAFLRALCGVRFWFVGGGSGRRTLARDGAVDSNGTAAMAVAIVANTSPGGRYGAADGWSS